MNLIRLKIEAFKSIKLNAKAKVGRGEFMLQANPETYSVAYAIDYSQEQPKGTAGHDPVWTKNQPKKLSFEFLFDGTGAIPDLKGTGNGQIESVDKQISKFENIVFNMNGDLHAPNYLRLSWGTLIFVCRLESITINYKLFEPNGNPLRAVINASFVEVTQLIKLQKKTKKKSPDVTHAFTIKEGDSLPLLAENVYGDPAYYIAVARANKLIQFRNLKAGSSVILPPIKKQDV